MTFPLVLKVAETLAFEFIPRREALEEQIKQAAKKSGLKPMAIADAVYDLVARRDKAGTKVTAEQALELLYGEQE